jgi:hypothetical protein
MIREWLNSGDVDTLCIEPYHVTDVWRPPPHYR